jgi:uncharacterized membrane protein
MHLASQHKWFLTLTAMAALCLGAFWLLLGTNYSPEVYRALPDIPGNLEIAWLLAGVVVTVVLLLAARPQPEECRCWAGAALVATAAACFVIARNLLGFHPTCLDPILFCTACGWTVTMGLRNQRRSLESGDDTNPNSTRLMAIIVALAAAGLSAYYVVQQLHYYNNLQLGYADCGDYARTMFNTLYNPRELFLRVNPDRPLFYDHFQPGFLPFVPLWFLWPGISITVLLQVLSVMACIAPIYWIGRIVLQDKTSAWLLVAAWLVFPPVSQFIYSGSYGFHCGTLCLPLYFLALAFWLDHRPGWALLLAAWAILIKEEAAIVTGTFGLYLALFENRLKPGLIIAAAAFGYFLIMTSVIIPAFAHQPYMALSHFPAIGKSHTEILFSPFTNPRAFWRSLFAPSTFYFGALLLSPLLFVPLRKPSVLFVGSLVFLFDCLDPALKSIRYWYQLALFPVVFWALAAALSRDSHSRQRAALSGAAVAGVLLSIFFGNVFWSKATMVALPAPTDRQEILQQIARRIDPHGSLFATQRAAAHFITQKYLYLNPPLPQSVDYVLLDLRDSWRATPNVIWLKTLRGVQRQAESQPQLRLVEAEDGILLYSRHGEPIDPRRLVERDALPPEIIRQSADLGKGVTFDGYTVSALPSHSADPVDHFLVTTFSSVATPVDADLAVRCRVQVKSARTHARLFGTQFQPLGQGVWPVSRWIPGKFYADEFRIDLPAGSIAAGLAMSFECQSL